MWRECDRGTCGVSVIMVMDTWISDEHNYNLTDYAAMSQIDFEESNDQNTQLATRNKNSVGNGRF